MYWTAAASKTFRDEIIYPTGLHWRSHKPYTQATGFFPGVKLPLHGLNYPSSRTEIKERVEQ
jgi:hypothetical protein